MLLLDEDGRLMDHAEVENLQKSTEGRRAFETMYWRNRSFATAVAVMTYLYPGGKPKKAEDDDFRMVFAIIETMITASEEEQDKFALLFAKQEIQEC